MTDQKENFFNVDEMEQGIRRTLADGLETRIFPGSDAMISVVRIAPNCRGDLHAHPEEQWGFLLRGSGVRTQDGTDFEVRQGDFWRTPGGIEHSFRAGEDGAVVIDVFAPPREEYKSQGAGFGAASA